MRRVSLGFLQGLYAPSTSSVIGWRPSPRRGQTARREPGPGSCRSRPAGACPPCNPCAVGRQVGRRAWPSSVLLGLDPRQPDPARAGMRCLTILTSAQTSLGLPSVLPSVSSLGLSSVEMSGTHEAVPPSGRTRAPSGPGRLESAWSGTARQSLDVPLGVCPASFPLREPWARARGMVTAQVSE